MENPKQGRYLRKRSLYRTVFGIFSLSGIMFAFQACYGTPEDFGHDAVIRGKVTSAATKAALPGIRVVESQSGQYTTTGPDGSYSMWCERMREYRLSFSDEETVRINRHQGRDTTLTPAWKDEVYLELEVNMELQ